MVYEQERDKFRALLRSKRNQLLEYREEWGESSKSLKEKEPEMEEEAQKDFLVRSIEGLDAQGTAMVEAIDRSLRKLETGSYGICERCGSTIQNGRLETVPWTSWCLNCAARQEKQSEAIIQEEAEDLEAAQSPDVDLMSDEQLEALVWDGVRNDGRVETDELEISVDNGRLILEGSLPSETKHRVLLQLLRDILGIRNIEDRLHINRQLWERPDRTPGKTEFPEKKEEEVISQGEEEKEDIYGAIEEGTSTLPPEKLIPERQE